MTAALVLGTLLAVGALAVVLHPLFFGVSAARQGAAARAAARAAVADNEDDLAIAALREIEFDRATGKLSDADYAELKERYTRQALAVMRRAPAGASVVGEYRSPADDEIEAAVRAFRARHLECPDCGPRPEPDAVFCSSCGRYLRGACPHCAKRLDASDARFCPECGGGLAA